VEEVAVVEVVVASHKDLCIHLDRQGKPTNHLRRMDQHKF
jgi:hypothetical protein